MLWESASKSTFSSFSKLLQGVLPLIRLFPFTVLLFLILVANFFLPFRYFPCVFLKCLLPIELSQFISLPCNLDRFLRQFIIA
jgi:hypothetical protein